MITIRNMAERKGQDWARAATHCVHGHAFDEKNTFWTDYGCRSCRECNRQRVKRQYARRLETPND